MDCMRASRAWIGYESTRDGGVKATKARGPSDESVRANGARVGARRAANAHDARELIDARVDASVED